MKRKDGEPTWADVRRDFGYDDGYLGTVVDMANAVFRRAGEHKDFGPEEYGEPDPEPEVREFGPEDYGEEP